MQKQVKQNSLDILSLPVVPDLQPVPVWMYICMHFYYLCQFVFTYSFSFWSFITFWSCNAFGALDLYNEMITVVFVEDIENLHQLLLVRIFLWVLVFPDSVCVSKSLIHMQA